MTSNEHNEAPYRVQMTDEAVYAYASIPADNIYHRMGELLKTLGNFPYYDQEYDPYYEAGRPPIPCRVMFCGRYGIYHVNDESRIVTVLAIEDERRNPRNRFQNL